MLLFRKAIVIIHGFTGNLYDNEYLMNYLELEPMYDVFASTLPGHNKDRFSDAKFEDWKNHVDEEITNLIKNGYKKIYVIGHSMGGVLAGYVASKYPEIKKVVFLNAAYDYFNFKQNKDDIKEKSLTKYSHLWQKIIRLSPFMINEFRKLVKDGNTYLNDVTCDALILRSTADEIIPYETGDLIYNGISSKTKYITDIKDATHRILSGDKKEITSEYIKMFLKGGIKWKKNIKKEI
jgi:esterase/lipase